MKRFWFAAVMIASMGGATAQPSAHVVRLKDKNNSPYTLSNPSAFLSAKSIQRRTRQNIAIDSSDLPVNPVYVDSISRLTGVTVLNTSKWLNHILVEVNDANALATINALSFVATSKVVAAKVRKRNTDISVRSDRSVSVRSATANNSSLEQAAVGDSAYYGNSYAQVHIHDGEYLHRLGYQGQNMLIAVLDGGFFKYTTNPALDSVRLNGHVKSEYDFVMNESSVDEDNVHGANCFSIMAANKPGSMVGTAPAADYLLYRTEDAGSEKPIEEQNWIAAAERADSIGADMISSSLGYNNFDDPSYNHSYQDRDGNTVPITIVADLAVKKGMIVVNAAGNSGSANNDSRYVMCPADGDSVLSVGAVDSTGAIAAFSSWGPNGAGKTKPSIVSVGAKATYANPSGIPLKGNGTSYAAPNIAGLIACLWQAFPDFTNMEIINTVQQSADKHANPDDRFGYGIPNFRIAYDKLMAERTKRLRSKLNKSWLTAYPVPFKNYLTVYLKAPATGRASIRLIDILGRIAQAKTMQVEKDNYYTVPLNVPTIRSGVYFLHYWDGKNKNMLSITSY